MCDMPKRNAMNQIHAATRVRILRLAPFRVTLRGVRLDGAHGARPVRPLVLRPDAKAGAPTGRRAPKATADAKYRKHAHPYKDLNIAFLPVIADTAPHPACMRMRCACSIMLPLSRALATSTTRASSGVRGRIIVSAAVGRTSSGATRPNWDSYSPPSVRSSGTPPSLSPSPFQNRGGREGGVVTATSRYTIAQHI